MQKTANYDLNQWDAGDRILRTDFNADNAKIDAAIKAASAAPYAKLKEITTTVDVAQVDLDFSDLDLTQYHKLEFFFNFAYGTYKDLVARINGISTGYFQTNPNTTAASALASLHADDPDWNGASGMMWWLGSGILCQTVSGRSGSYINTGVLGYETATKGTPETVNLLVSGSSSGIIKAGTKISIYGVRA